jgi:hypothetical protein
MNNNDTTSKVAAITLGFWIIKIFATTLGETGGDSVTMTMNLGYFVGSAIFLSALVVMVILQVRARRFHPFLYWGTIVASTTAGTTMADFADRSLGIGYPGGSLLLFACVILTLGLWRVTQGRSPCRACGRPGWRCSTGPRSRFRRRWAPRSATGPPMPASGMAAARWCSRRPWCWSRQRTT